MIYKAPLKIVLVLFSFISILACQNHQKKIDAENDLFQKEYDKGIESLDKAKDDIHQWKEMRNQIRELPSFKANDEELVRSEKDLTRFLDELEGFESELKTMKNLSRDFETMKLKNVKKVSELRLKRIQKINKKIDVYQGTLRRISERINTKYFN